MKSKKFWLIVTTFLLSVCVIIGVCGCSERKYNSITASAATSSTLNTSNDDFSLAFSGLSVKNDQLLGLKYQISRTLGDNNTGALQKDTVQNGSNGYEMEGYAQYDFTLQTSNDFKILFVKMWVTMDYVYLYVHNDSYPGYGMSFNLFGNLNVSVHSDSSTYQSDVTFDNYRCVYKVKNSTGNVLPYVNNSMFFEVYGEGLDVAVGYQVVMDYSLAHFSDETYKLYYSQDGWEGVDNFIPGTWTEELFGSYFTVKKMYVVSTQEDYTNSGDKAIDADLCEYKSALRTNKTSLKAECLNVFDAGNAVSVFGAENSTTYEYAYKLAYDVVKKMITVQYLKDLDFTPFAYLYEEKNVEVEICADDTVIGIAAMQEAFKKKDLEFPLFACNSAIEKFEILDGVSATTFKAVYYPSQYVGLKTEEGNVQYTVLDCNKSFYDYYYPMMEILDEVTFGEGSLLGVIMNRIILENYKVLVDSYGMTQDNTGLTYEIDEAKRLYGLWGWGVLPHTEVINLNDLLFVDLKTETESVLKCYDFRGNMTNAAYKELLEAYDYSNFYSSINTAADWFTDDTNCTYLVFFCDGENEVGGIGAGDADIEDDDPTWQNKLEEFGDGVGNFFKDLFSNDPELDFSRLWKICGITLASAAGLVCLYQAIKRRK